MTRHPCDTSQSTRIAILFMLSTVMLACIASTSAGPSTAWVHAPMPGVVTFTLTNAEQPGVVLINGTRYWELSYGACACAQDFALPVRAAGWYSIHAEHGELERWSWVFGEWTRSSFEKMRGCSVLYRAWTAHVKSRVHWLVRPCVGRVVLDVGSDGTQFVNCVDARTVSQGAGVVRWEVCKDSDPFKGDGYQSGAQFAVWIEPKMAKKQLEASTVTNREALFLTEGVVVMRPVKQHDAAVDVQFWTVSIDE